MHYFLLIFILSACSSVLMDSTHNTPFVNSTETSKLDFDMTKEEVLDILGEPLIVKRGIGESKTIIWIYEVRTILVEGKEVIESPSNIIKIAKEFEPMKRNKNYKHDIAHHKLELEFIKGLLVNWHPESDSKKKRF